MALKAKLATLEGLDESTAALYRQEAEGAPFVLDVEAVDGLGLADTTAHTAALQEREGKLSEATAALADRDKRISDLSIESEARIAVLRAGGSEKLLLPHLRSMLMVHKGTVVARGSDGKPRVSNEPGSNEPMGLPELLKEMESDADFKLAFGLGRKHFATGATGGDWKAERLPLY